MHTRGYDKAFDADGTCIDLVEAFDSELRATEESFRLYDLAKRYSGPIHSKDDLKSGKLDENLAAFESG